MPTTTANAATIRLQPARTRRTDRGGWWLRWIALAPPLLAVALGVQLACGSAPARVAFGWSFFSRAAWNPVTGQFGAWPFIFGTLVTTAIAVVLAAPLGIGAAAFLSEAAPPWLDRPLTGMMDLMLALPSVIYGLWGLSVLVPWLRLSAEPWLQRHSHGLPLFQGTPYGLGLLAAGLILAIMVTPMVMGQAREAVRAVPREHRAAAYALGSTHWEVVSRVVLPAARPGIVAGVLLAVGRALGETMAVVMVIGNRPAVSASLFAPGYTLASALANEFTEATTPLYTAALIELGLILFAITVLVNLAARSLSSRSGEGAL